MSKLLESFVELVSDRVDINELTTCAVLHHDDSITIFIDPRTISRIKLTEKDMYNKLSVVERGSLYYSATTDINGNTYQIMRAHRNAFNIPMENPASIDHAITDILPLSKLVGMIESTDDENESRIQLISLIRKLSSM